MDAEAVFQGYASSENATRDMIFPRHDSIDQSVEFTERCERCWMDGSAFPWAIVQKQTDQLVGCIELRLDPPKADFGYILCEKFWRQGFATEAAQLIVDWTWIQSDIFRIWATCSPENSASARVLSKLGLTLEARLEAWEARPQLNKPAGPSMVYAKIKSHR